MEKELVSESSEPVPLQIRIIGWFGIILGSMYLIYSIVNIILSFLDRTQGDFLNNFLILIYGIPIVAFSAGFLNRQKWGWIGFTLILAIIIVLSIIGNKDLYGIILGLLSATALVWILTPSIRKQYFPS